MKQSDETTILMSSTLITSPNNNELTNTNLPLYLNDINEYLELSEDSFSFLLFIIIKKIDKTEQPQMRGLLLLVWIFLRLNQTSILAERTGVFYGQCSEICGAYHSFMPIAIEAVSVSDYLTWIDQA